jgi:hypothetical protein
MFLTSTYVQTRHDHDGKTENVGLVRNIRLTDLKRSNIILDLKKKEVVKCRDYQKEGKVINSGDSSYDELFNYFYASYPKQIDMALEVIKQNE